MEIWSSIFIWIPSKVNKSKHSLLPTNKTSYNTIMHPNIDPEVPEDDNDHTQSLSTRTSMYHDDNGDDELSFDVSSKFTVNSIDGRNDITPDDDDEDDDNDDVFAMHSIPHPGDITEGSKSRLQQSERKPMRAIQTFAGVAGNILEW